MSEEALEKPVHQILLVDDEPNILKALRRLLLTVEDFEVRVATSAAEGIRYLKEKPAAVVVSDQRMPEVTGAEFLEQVQKRWPETVRILLTGYADIEASIAAINRGGIFRYLTKPWDETELLAAIRAAANSYWMVQENKRLNGVIARQNVEMQQWNNRLKQRVLEQTASIRHKNDALAGLNHQLQQNFDATLQAISSLAELQDPQATAHSSKVAEIAVKMAKDLKLSSEMQEQIRVAALLHDIGKIGIDRALLESLHLVEVPPEAQRQYQLHPIRGQAAIDRVEPLRQSGILIRHHHENFDGSGFPDQLAAEDIPLGSRILALADGFERLLRTAADMNRALARIRQDLGSLYDPALCSALERAAVEACQTAASTTAVRMQLSPAELAEGMQLEQDIVSGSGLLLLVRGSRLTHNDIDAILRYYHIDPFPGRIRVLVERH